MSPIQYGWYLIYLKNKTKRKENESHKLKRWSKKDILDYYKAKGKNKWLINSKSRFWTQS